NSALERFARPVTYVISPASCPPSPHSTPFTTHASTTTTRYTHSLRDALPIYISWSFATGLAPDTIAPVLGATGPANADTNVPLNETNTTPLSETIDASTNNTTTFTLIQGSTPVPGTVTYVDGVAIFTPADHLA